ncbi:MAG: TIGR02302 family protein [Minwuia thermotolerans]|nr:MAG: TIGR02302 family protein [Minwuia thermotolerans]
MADERDETLDSILDPQQRAALGRKLWATRLILGWERLVPLLWPGFAAVLLLVSVTLLGIWQLLPPVLHLVGLAAGVLGCLFLLLRGLLAWQRPSTEEVVQRLERSGGAHRPLTSVQDQIAVGRDDSAARSLWQAHRRQMASRIGALRLPVADTRMPSRDPLALRLLVLMIFCLSLAAAGGRTGDRLIAALDTGAAADGLADDTVLEAWVTPPAHTGMPPVFISALTPSQDETDTSEPLAVPTGSRFLARYHGAAEPALAVADTLEAFERVGEKDLQIERLITAGDRLSIRDGEREIAGWPISIIPDHHPTIELTEPPQGTLRGALRLAYRASDDYGIAGVAVRITRDGHDGEIILDLPLSSRRPMEAIDTVFRDLAAHPWAGKQVVLVMEARDDADQSGRSEPLTFELPERTFKQPAARAVIELRQRLFDDASGQREWVVRALHALMINPKRYHSDFAVHIGLSMLASDLTASGDAETIAASQQMLWQTALRIEDGNISVAQARLRDIQERLSEALANGASEAEIQALMDELQEAMDEYLRAMQQDAQRRMEAGEDLPELDGAESVERQSLADMLDKARELSRSGARDQARQMLSQLQNMLENLQMGNQGGRAQSEQQAERLADQLGQMMEQQQQLMDRTFERRQQQAQPDSKLPSQTNPFNSPGRNRFGRSQSFDQNKGARGGTPGQQSEQDLADAQGQLRRRLGELMQQLGESMGNIPGELGEAEQAMRSAQSSLGAGQSDQAMDEQAQALDRLRRGAESVLQDLADQGQGQAQNQDAPGQDGRNGEPTDPLGRSPTDSWGEGTGDMVPAQSALQRSREILDELRRRSGQRSRSTDELDYIMRLLRQF